MQIRRIPCSTGPKIPDYQMLLITQNGLGNPFTNDIPRLEYVLAGVKRQEAYSGTKAKSRLPITVRILQLLKNVWTYQPGLCDAMSSSLHRILWLPSGRQVYSSIPASIQPSGIWWMQQFDSYEAPSLVRLLIKQSKTDPFCQGVEIFLGATKTDVCPVHALIQFLAIHDSTPGALFKAVY